MDALAPAAIVRPSAPLDQLTYTVLDLETTGGAPPEHRITEIAAWRVSGLEVAELYHTLVNPQRHVPSFVSNLTGLTTDMLRRHPPSAKVLGPLLEFIGDSVIVAHHSEFDLKFINHELKRARMRPLLNRDLCTCKLARRLLPWVPSKSLGNLANFFGLTMSRRHRAEDDALATAQLLVIMLRYLQHRGLATLEEAYAYQEGHIELPGLVPGRAGTNSV